MEMLFDKFYKGPKGSFGLGLYIARKIAIFHGGDIWAENVENGVQFHVALKNMQRRKFDMNYDLLYTMLNTESVSGGEIPLQKRLRRICAKPALTWIRTKRVTLLPTLTRKAP